MWMKGERVRVPTSGKNGRYAFFGALNVVTGEWLPADHDRKLGTHFLAFLKRVAAAYPTGVLYVALDSASAHTASLVQEWIEANRRVVLWCGSRSTRRTSITPSSGCGAR
ncbi:MAG: transposase [Chloroflexota bacterium]|nr:transposase [Chloroflexota bacterium]